MSWLIKSGFVSVGYTPPTTDICVCCRHVDNVGRTRRQHSLKSDLFSAVGVVSGNRIPDTLSCVYVGISTDEVVTTYEDKNFLASSQIFHPLASIILTLSKSK